MARQGKKPFVTETIVLPKPELSKDQVSTYNQQVGDSALETQNVDEGFAHYVSHFKSSEPVNAAIQIEQGVCGEQGWRYSLNKEDTGVC
jgi:hypothetical protein